MNYLLRRTDFVAEKDVSLGALRYVVENFGKDRQGYGRLELINLAFEGESWVVNPSSKEEKKSFEKEKLRATVVVAPGYYRGKGHDWSTFVAWLGWNSLSWQISHFAWKRTGKDYTAHFDGAQVCPPVAIALLPIRTKPTLPQHLLDYICMICIGSNIVRPNELRGIVKGVAERSFSKACAEKITAEKAEDYAEPELRPVPVILGRTNGPSNQTNDLRRDRLINHLKGPDMLFCVPGLESATPVSVEAYVANDAERATMEAKAHEIVADPSKSYRFVALLGFDAAKKGESGPITLTGTRPTNEGEKPEEYRVDIERHSALVCAKPPQFAVLWLFKIDNPVPSPLWAWLRNSKDWLSGRKAS